jgi:DNA-binding Lrp family transcriptional regulator
VVRSYVLIEMNVGHSKGLVGALKGHRGIKAIDRVTGPYDVIAIVEAADINKVSEIVSNEIHSLPGVVRTTTCVSLET